MTVTCVACGKIFKYQINAKHLMRHHGITSSEYKELYPSARLLTKSTRPKKIRVAWNIGIPQTKQAKAKFRATRKKNKIPAWNKGVKVTDPIILKNIQDASDKREEKYNNGTLTRAIKPPVTKKTKAKIRKARKNQKNSPENNPDIITKMVDGAKPHNRQRKIEGNIKLNNLYEDGGYRIIGDMQDPDLRKDKLILIEHISCGSIVTRNPESAVNTRTLCPNCSIDASSRSNPEIEVAKFVKSILPNEFMIQSDKSTLDGLEIDILLPNLKIAIEFCGLYWHGEKTNTKRFYHQRKWQLAKTKGLHLIQIFEDEWVHKQDVVKASLKRIRNQEERIILAPDCQISDVDEQIAKEFFEKYNMEGHWRAYYYIGLYYEEELVSVMSFSKSKKENSGSTWIVSRFSSSCNVIRAENVLIEAFKQKEADVSKILFYADNRWCDEKLYKELNMTLENEGFPVFWYVKGTKRFHRNTLKKTADEDQTKSEKELRKEQKYYRIWDCGSSCWSWTKE